jgi:metal-sulfur cluster biosynthetic enzyme
MELDASVRAKFDDVLERVKEPQSLLSLAELGLVSSFNYSAKGKVILVRLNIGSPRFQCPACSAINGEVKMGIERLLREELGKEFPGFAVDYDKLEPLE